MRQRSADEEARTGQTAADLVPFAEELTHAVHEYGRDEVEKTIYRHLGLQPGVSCEIDTAIAAFVVLAAFGNPGQTPQEALAWITWDEHGYPLGRAA